jgi:dTDP-4-dehydrorhamnose reductase
VRILVTGATGQVGARVVDALAGHDVLAAARDTLDLAEREQIEQVVAEFGPDAVVNTAAMTNVDACERDPEQAFTVNALGVRTLALAAARRGAHLVHVSTDYVFDGQAARPYDEWDAVRPVSEYGRSKLGGEVEVARHAGSWATVRTSWVFGRRGTDLLSWAFDAFDRGALDGVLADQVSIPTYAPDLAVLLARFAVERRQGLFHVTSGSEAVTRHELITTALRARGVDPSGIAPLDAADLDRPAARPPMSALDNRALRLAGLPGLRAWRDAVTDYVKDWPGGPAPQVPGAGS